MPAAGAGVREQKSVVYLVRHGQTAWSLSGQHTGRADIPLTSQGESEAERVGRRLASHPFAHVLASPLRRARQTAELAGFGERAELVGDLMEFDYGDYEGLTADEIRGRAPGWDIYRDGCPGGESVAEVVARADRVVERLHALGGGDTLVFAHKHFLQFLATRWIRLPGEAARHLVLDTASVSILGYHHSPGNTVLRLWNDAHHLDSA